MGKREDSGWQPEWDETFRGWALNFIRENKWKLEAVHDIDDLEQDAYLTFRRVKASYPRVTQPKHFMALFKVALSNEWIDRAQYKKRKNEVEISIDEDHLYLTESVGIDSNEGYLRIVLEELPIEAKLVLALFKDPEKLKLLRELPRKSQFRENLNMKLCRILGLPKGTQLVEMMKEALT